MTKNEFLIDDKKHLDLASFVPKCEREANRHDIMEERLTDMMNSKSIFVTFLSI